MVVEVDVEVVGVAAGGPTVSEQDAMTRQAADATRASLCLDKPCPLTPRIKKTPVKFVQPTSVKAARCDRDLGTAVFVTCARAATTNRAGRRVLVNQVVHRKP